MKTLKSAGILLAIIMVSVFSSGCAGIPSGPYGSFSNQPVQSEPVVGAGSISVRPGGETVAVIYNDDTGMMPGFGANLAALMRGMGYVEASPERADYIIDVVAEDPSSRKVNPTAGTGTAAGALAGVGTGAGLAASGVLNSGAATGVGLGLAFAGMAYDAIQDHYAPVVLTANLNLVVDERSVFSNEKKSAKTGGKSKAKKGEYASHKTVLSSSVWFVESQTSPQDAISAIQANFLREIGLIFRR
ncbi:MAG TPA: hypothetical protein PLK35_00805 [Candidatus Moranbacteria bacterium]|nr:hypothetical protein [Candidatus Moranbacteria bacterium]